jgi:predicted DNA-binding protein
MRTKPMKVAVGTRIEKDLADRLDRLAAVDMSSQAALIRKCIARYVPQLEKEILGVRGPEIAQVDPEPEMEEVANG